MYKKRQRRFLFTWCFLILDVFTQCGNRSCAQADNDVAWFQGRSQNTCDIIDFARPLIPIPPMAIKWYFFCMFYLYLCAI